MFRINKLEKIHNIILKILGYQVIENNDAGEMGKQDEPSDTSTTIKFPQYISGSGNSGAAQKTT